MRSKGFFRALTATNLILEMIFELNGELYIELWLIQAIFENPFQVLRGKNIPIYIYTYNPQVLPISPQSSTRKSQLASCTCQAEQT